GCGRGELREDISHRRVSRGLALRARRVVRARHLAPAARHRRSLHHASAHPMSARPKHPGDAHEEHLRELREDAAPRAPVPLHGNILYLEHLTVSFDGFKALDDLTLYVDPGELRCIIGPNGAGKTTMMDVVTGKTRPDEGSAWFGRKLDLL